MPAAIRVKTTSGWQDIAIQGAEGKSSTLFPMILIDGNQNDPWNTGEIALPLTNMDQTINVRTNTKDANGNDVWGPFMAAKDSEFIGIPSFTIRSKADPLKWVTLNASDQFYGTSQSYGWYLNYAGNGSGYLGPNGAPPAGPVDVLIFIGGPEGQQGQQGAIAVYEQPSAPASPSIGAVWVDTDDQPAPAGGNAPPGGAISSVLTKKSATDYDFGWISPQSPSLVLPVRLCRGTNFANIATAALGTTEDGVTVATNDLILVRAQTNPAENGLYMINASRNLVRVYPELHRPGQLIYVQQGTNHKAQTWQMVSPAIPFSVGSSLLYITRISPAYSMPMFEPQWGAYGYVYATMPEAAATQSIPAGGYSGFLQGAILHLRAGVPIAGVSVVSGTTAGASLTNSWCALVDCVTFQILAVTNNITTAAWNLMTQRVFTFTSVYTPIADRAVWFGLCVVGTTLPSFPGLTIAEGGGSGFLTLTGINPYVSLGSGYTTPPAVGTVVSPGSQGRAIFARLTTQTG